MNLTQILYTLPTERLREIVRSRAATIHGLPRVKDKLELARALSSVLTNFYSVQRALKETTRSQFSVLTAIVARNGQVSFSSLKREVQDHEVDRLERAVNELEALGLAFWIPLNGGRGVFVPRGVAQHVPLPAPLRFQLDSALHTLAVPALQGVAKRLDIKLESEDQGVLALAVKDKLSEPDDVRRQLDRLSPEGILALEVIVMAEGEVSLQTLAQSVDSRRRRQILDLSWNPYRPDSEPRNGIEEVLARALAFQQGAGGWGGGRLVMPIEILRAVSDSAYARVLPEEPGWDTPAADSPVQTHDSLLRDTAYLLGYIRRNEAPQTAARIMYRTSLKSLSRGMSIRDQDYTDFVYALSCEAGLIAAGGRKNAYGITRRGGGWLALSPMAQRKSLFDTWQGSAMWSESASAMLTDGKAYFAEGARSLRDSIVALLSERAESVSISSLALHAAFRWWARFPNDLEEARELTQRIVRSLFWLGAVELDTPNRPAVTRFTPQGESWARGEVYLREQTPANEKFILQPNLEIFAPSNLPVSTMYRLFSIADSAGSGMLVLSRDSLRQAMDSGETVESIMEFFRKGSQTAIPQNVEYLLREVGGRHGHIEVGQAGLYIKVDDAALLKEILAAKALKIRFRRTLSDNVALITGDSVDSVLKALRQAGYFPLSADQKAGPPESFSRPAADAFDDTDFFVRPLSTGNELDTRIDWGAVTADDGTSYELEQRNVESLPKDESTYMERLIWQAIDEFECVEIAYKPADGSSITQRVIEPVEMNGPLIYAFCRLRQDWRNFNIRCIRAARLTGERFEEREF